MNTPKEVELTDRELARLTGISLRKVREETINGVTFTMCELDGVQMPMMLARALMKVRWNRAAKEVSK